MTGSAVDSLYYGTFTIPDEAKWPDEFSGAVSASVY